MGLCVAKATRDSIPLSTATPLGLSRDGAAPSTRPQARFWNGTRATAEGLCRASPKVHVTLWDNPTVPVSGRPCPEVTQNPKAPWGGSLQLQLAGSIGEDLHHTPHRTQPAGHPDVLDAQ